MAHLQRFFQIVVRGGGGIEILLGVAGGVEGNPATLNLPLHPKYFQWNPKTLS